MGVSLYIIIPLSGLYWSNTSIFNVSNFWQVTFNYVPSPSSPSCPLPHMQILTLTNHHCLFSFTRWLLQPQYKNLCNNSINGWDMFAPAKIPYRSLYVQYSQCGACKQPDSAQQYWCETSETFSIEKTQCTTRQGACHCNIM